MIFIVVKFDVARRYRESWMSITKEFTPQIIHTEIPSDGWAAMGELHIDTTASENGGCPNR